MKKLHAGNIELALARFFNPRINIIVPNVSWGLGFNYECDLLVVTKAGYATEIEIKVTRSDIKADFSKRHTHGSKKIRRFFYAVPDYLSNCDLLPTDCGLISIDENLRCRTLRPPKLNKMARALTDKEINKLLHLGCMRIWSLKESLYARR